MEEFVYDENNYKPHKNSKPIKYTIDEKGCFICTSHCINGKDGYYRIKRGKGYILVHRYIYEQEFGSIEDGFVVRHKCDNSYCINPDHLEVGTHQDNVNDRVERGRTCFKVGESNGMSKLSNEDVLNIRREDRSVMLKDLSKKYGVSIATIGKIRNNQIWKHLGE